MSSYRSGQDDPNVAWTLALGAVMASAVLVRWLAHVSVLALAGLAIGPGRRGDRRPQSFLPKISAAEPGAGDAAAGAATAAPRSRACDGVRAAAAVGAAGGGAAGPPVPAVAVRAGAAAAPVADLGAGGAGPVRARVRVPVEEHVIYIAPPRAGKTGTLAEIIARHPGAVVATSTRGDLHELTARVRASRGPVYVFNPQRLAEVPSTMRWDMLARVRRPGDGDPAGAAAVRDGRVQGRGGGLLGRGDRAVAADAAARRGAAAAARWTWCTTGRCSGPRGSSCVRCPARAGKPSGGAR